MFDDLFNWIDQSPRSHSIYCAIAVVKDRPNREGSTIRSSADYAAAGEMNMRASGTMLRGTSVMAFSDRIDGNTDKWEVVISRDGQVEVTLLGWTTNAARLEKVQRIDHEGGHFATGYLDEIGIGLVSFSFDLKKDPYVR